MKERILTQNGKATWDIISELGAAILEGDNETVRKFVSLDSPKPSSSNLNDVNEITISGPSIKKTFIIGQSPKKKWIPPEEYKIDTTQFMEQLYFFLDLMVPPTKDIDFATILKVLSPTMRLPVSELMTWQQEIEEALYIRFQWKPSLGFSQVSLQQY